MADTDVQTTTAKTALPADHPPVAIGKVGVLLVNLGTPDATDPKSMRRYLAEFLTDRRVIELSPWLWYPILYGVILNRRPKRVGEAYRKIWNNERDESYLRTYTRAQAEKLQARLDGGATTIVVDWAMRYGTPTIAGKLDALQQKGCDRIVLFPLYPQYSAPTTATVNDKAFAHLATLRWQPAMRTVPPYYDRPSYITALASSIREQLARLDWRPDVIVASYHGIPQSYFNKGDPYHCHCHKTTRLLRDALELKDSELITTFQSRFGSEEWLQPYTDVVLEDLAREGRRNVAVVNPGFVSDCLETLEEIAVEGRETFVKAGGENFFHLACLNDTSDGLDVLEDVVRRELAGWA